MNKSIFAGLVVLVLLAVAGCRSTAIGIATPASSAAVSTASTPADAPASTPADAPASTPAVTPASSTADAPASAPADAPASSTAVPAGTQAAVLASAYNMAFDNFTYGSSDGTLTHVTENATGDISGQMTVDPPLYGSGPFTGTVSGNAIKFTVESDTPNPVNAISATFSGTIGVKGSLSGTYVGYTSNGPQNGNWTASPATATVTGGEACVFSAPSGSFGLAGHVGWGFELTSGTWEFGANEGPYYWPLRKADVSKTWDKTGSFSVMLATFTEGGPYNGTKHYTTYKCETVPEPDAASAVTEVSNESHQYYAILVQDCLSQVYNVLNKYGATGLPNDILDPVPNTWYNDLSGFSAPVSL